jgi:hypothetical protein
MCSPPGGGHGGFFKEQAMLFRKNTVTGIVMRFDRGDDASLSVTIERPSGTLTLLVYGEVADQLELVH